MTANLNETSQGWTVGFDNCAVQLIKIDFRLGLVFSDKDETFELQIETPFKLVSAGGTVTCVPENATSLAPVLSLANVKVISLEIQRTGKIDIKFGAGFSIVIEPDPAYEAWQLSGSSGFLFVCPPEGDISFFR